VLIVAEMLEHDPALPASMLSDVRTIRRNVDLEIRLIEDLVDLTRISFGKLRLTSEQVNLQDPIRGAMEVVEADLHEKELTLTTHLTSEPAMVVGDAVRLQQVFWNLLRNAIKFTPAGGRISITMNRKGDDFVIEVSDSGIGIATERLTQIFQAFEQGDIQVQSRYGGLGLGLAISQALVQAHGGTIAASSEGTGRGATFAIELPAMRELGSNADVAPREVARAARVV
jgi:signal transduction histidine kinase